MNPPPLLIISTIIEVLQLLFGFIGYKIIIVSYNQSPFWGGPTNRMVIGTSIALIAAALLSVICISLQWMFWSKGNTDYAQIAALVGMIPMAAAGVLVGLSYIFQSLK